MSAPSNPRLAARRYGLLLVGILSDIDHLLADPIYDPERCSIGFHPLHTLAPAIVYLLLVIPRQTRWVGLGLCFHILLDASDCDTEALLSAIGAGTGQ